MTHIDTNPFLAPQEEGVKKWSWLFWLYCFFGVAVGVVLTGILLAIFLPTVHRNPPRHGSFCRINLKQVAIALLNYEQAHGSLPPAYTVDANGAPLHSWRVLILPYMEEKKLYDSIDLTKPWNDPANEKARKETPVCYRCPSPTNRYPQGYTTYLANAWEKGVFVPGDGRSMNDIADGASNTIVAFEVNSDQAVEWMSPQDGNYETFLKTMSLPTPPHSSGLNVAFADGACDSVSKRYADMYLPWFTIAEGDKVEIKNMNK